MNTDQQAVLHPASEALDALTLSRLAQLDPTGQSRLVQRVLTTYLQSLARLRQQITDSLDQADLSAVRLGAHTLKSSSASIGALQLSSLCALVEQAIREGQRERLADLMSQLHGEVDRVDEAVRQLIAN
ncbi:MAG: Hpt domain-containing protein [Ideonella sp.]|jgi:HPt (histidine-containing phosphotransfer) domain-containing protein|nr:Hpt domain-containing protein [Ideonella sp.]MBL0148797.1 Hpt domain-containing protein [Ideonella sp.]